MSNNDEAIEQGYIRTYTGKRFFPLNPCSDDICIEDIAHALSNICRFTGHTQKFYSVAEHSLRVANKVPEELRLWALLHDASEAYISDISSPLKHQPAFAAYQVAEFNLQRTIYNKFGLSGPTPEPIYRADKAAFEEEKRNLIPFWKGCEGKPEWEPMKPGIVEWVFLTELKSALRAAAASDRESLDRTIQHTQIQVQKLTEQLAGVTRELADLQAMRRRIPFYGVVGGSVQGEPETQKASTVISTRDMASDYCATPNQGNVRSNPQSEACVPKYNPVNRAVSIAGYSVPNENDHQRRQNDLADHHFPKI